MRVESLFIYPVKSLRGIALDVMELDEFGPQNDRRWMIVDSQGQFITQRTHSVLANVITALSDQGVVIDIPGMPSQVLEVSSTERRVRVWRDWVLALEAAPGPSEMMSEFLGEPVTFVYMPDSTFREVDTRRVGDSRRVGFADGFPFLIVNQASLDDLNGRLERPVDIRRFRPNIVVSGRESWEEDRWSDLVIADVEFRLVKPCSRCVLTTVDPDRGVKSADLEPLRTLGSFRRTADGVMFGMNAVHQPGRGQLSVGDSVKIL